MTDVKTLYAKIDVDSQKINKFINSFSRDYEAGRVSIEEIEQALVDELLNFTTIKIIQESK